MPSPLRLFHCALALTVLMSVSTTALLSAENDDGFVPMFNGRDLSGWRHVNTAPSTWAVKDGMLICSGKPIGELRTERMYQNFVLELEWRHMVPKGNAGVFVWADDITAPGVPFHRGIEVQVLENAYGKAKWFTTHGDIFPIHGAKMTPVNGRGGSRAFPIEERSKPSPEWNHYRIECRDGDISLAVNGKVVTRGKDCSPSKGYICLESEGGVVHYRNVRIKELPDTPVKPEDIAIAERGYHSIYTGVDLSGWKTNAAVNKAWKVSDWVLAGSANGNESGAALTTTETFEDYDFIIDVRLKSKDAIATILPRGTNGGISTSDIAEHLAPQGKWTRIEGQVRGNRVTLTANGQPVKTEFTLKDSGSQAPLAIQMTSGNVDFANLYVRGAK